MRIIFTVLTGNYDTLQPPTYIDSDCTYVCFTDNPDPSSVPHPYQHIHIVVTDNDPVMTQRMAKLGGVQQLLFKLDIIPFASTLFLYHDANMQQVSSAHPLFNEYQASKKHTYAVMSHPHRQCAYDEIAACIAKSKDQAHLLEDYAMLLNLRGVPKHGGMIASGVMVTDVRSLYFLGAWSTVLNHSQLRRDQVAWALAHYLNPSASNPLLVNYHSVIGPMFKIHPHNK